jgi:uncharacterized RDD family membrane protein YckC
MRGTPTRGDAVTAPQDPFAAPDDSGSQPQGTPQPGYGQPPGGFGTPPAYGSTPYGAAPSDAWQGPPLASWGLRVGGALIDGVISFAASNIVGIINDNLGNLVGLAIFLYFGYLTGTTGQTPGRQVVKIKVLREADGQPLGAGAGIGRAFLHILDVISIGIGYLWPLWDKKNQTFADKAIHSVVIKV